MLLQASRLKLTLQSEGAQKHSVHYSLSLGRPFLKSNCRIFYEAYRLILLTFSGSTPMSSQNFSMLSGPTMSSEPTHLKPPQSSDQIKKEYFTQKRKCAKMCSLSLHQCLSNGCSAVNGCRQNESLIKTSQ